MILLLISFIAGCLTVLAPCILPLLPIIVGGSFEPNEISKKKSIVVILSLGVSVLVFTFLLKVSTLFINVPESFWKWLSGGIIIAIGLITIFPKLWSGKLLSQLNINSNILLGKGNKKKSIWGDIIVGASLGPVFSTCSPTYFIILATILPVSLLLGYVYMIAYVTGLCISLFVVTYFSSKVASKLGLLSDENGYFKKILGVLFILVGIFIITGQDKKIEAYILNKGYFDVTTVENYLNSINKPDEVIKVETPPAPQIKETQVVEPETPAKSNVVSEPIKPMENKVNKVVNTIVNNSELQLAPDISTPDGFINTEGKPITLSELRGKKVVLVSFWTYSCINCKRTLPYLNEWYSKYKDQGFEIVSIHTPEFSFEKVQKNVEDAVKVQDIKYPVVLDNDFSTWQAYGNQYWPRKYLVNKDGYIIYDHAGEGAYEETESKIKEALKELKQN